MVHTRTDNSWMRRGFSLLWGVETLAKMATPDQVVSLRQFFSLAESWPESLPSSNGDALVVSGFEGCLDILDIVDAERWIQQDLKDNILSFQEEFEGQAALIFWVPSGRGRIRMHGASEEYHWKTGSRKSDKDLHIGRLLWAGAENEVERIIDADGENLDYDSKAYVGLHHPRIS